LTKRSCAGCDPLPGSIGFQSVAGASVGAIETLRGPVRRSRYGAIDCRQESAACCRSAGVIVTCTSFSASANVAGVTTGPAAVPAPNVGGAPGVGDVAGGDEGCGWLRHAAAPTRNPSGAATRNWRRVFMRGDRIDRLRLLRTFEQSAVDGLAE